MAHFRERKGRFTAIVDRVGFDHKCKTFDSLEKAKEWAKVIEDSINKEKERRSMQEVWGENFYIPNFNLEINHILYSRIRFEKTQGVYFLILNKEIIYIGMTNHVFRRINQHQNDGKIFDSFFYIKCQKEKCAELEKFYIKKFMPKFNIEHKENSHRKKYKTNKVKKSDVQNLLSLS